MISVENAISRFRRDLTFSALPPCRAPRAAAACILLGPMLGEAFNGYLILGLIAGIWLILSYRRHKARASPPTPRRSSRPGGSTRPNSGSRSRSARSRCSVRSS